MFELSKMVIDMIKLRWRQAWCPDPCCDIKCGDKDSRMHLDNACEIALLGEIHTQDNRGRDSLREETRECRSVRRFAS